MAHLSEIPPERIACNIRVHFWIPLVERNDQCNFRAKKPGVMRVGGGCGGYEGAEYK